MLVKQKHGTIWKTAQHNQRYWYSAFQVFIALCTHCFAVSLKRSLWDWSLFPYCRWENWGRENSDFLKLLIEWMAKVRCTGAFCIRIFHIHGFQIPLSCSWLTEVWDLNRACCYLQFWVSAIVTGTYIPRIWGKPCSDCQGSLAATPHQRLPCQVCYFNFPLSSATSTIII